MGENRKPFSNQITVLMNEYGTGRLSEISGISDTMLRKWRAGTSLPGLANLEALSEATGRSIQWLATGKEPAASGVVGSLPTSQPADDDEFVYVNDYSVEASAGHGSEVGYEIVTQRLAFRKDWIKQEGLDPRKLAILWAKGDSMEPSILHGDILLVEVLSHEVGAHTQYGTKDGLPPRDGIYIIRLDGHLVVKRIQLDMQGGFFVKSDNEAYNQIHITRAQLHADTQEPKPEITGRVVWFGRSI